MNYISSNIKYLRLKNKLTQEDISKAVQKTRNLVNQWESSKRGIRLEDVAKLSEFFDVPMSYLLYKDLRNNDNTNTNLEIYIIRNIDLLNQNDKVNIKTIIDKRKDDINKENNIN